MTLYHRNKNTCWEEKIRFAILWQQGFSARTISKMARRSPTTVRKWVRHLQETSLIRLSTVASLAQIHNLDLLILATLSNQGYTFPYHNLRSSMFGCQHHKSRPTWEGSMPNTEHLLQGMTGSVSDIKFDIKQQGHSNVTFPSSLCHYPNASNLLRCDEEIKARSFLT